ncbi:MULTISPECIES: GNAT family N-acetyltransferase [unclassified Streptomyces]|uniref:GNAT family N-acetyltransferase n=1 Tax=unclassified Streptomyces TaxID=2593676 RepID=UPI00236612B7|nr:MULTISPECIES: GNAT family N-acetyltransferase [unclassified Streptomyces]MDF3139966.1 GNAT family N-acetyltransferase [Streptomyces sp. T21Q-yed]WDF39894.1 GNAT family N-acetyltransferase [Streptomyces sp. T12]
MSSSCCGTVAEVEAPAIVVLAPEPESSGCCGPAPEPETTGCCIAEVAEAEPESSGCCTSQAAEPEPEADSCCGTPEPVAVSCCGTAQEPAEAPATVLAGLTLDEALDHLGGSVPHATNPSPYLHPSWLRATEVSMDGAKPWHTVARRGGGEGAETAFLPGYLFDADPLVDVDPRTYLGWQPKSGETACCSVTSCCTDTVSQVEALGTEPFFPALLLGSPLGYRSETAASVEDPLLVADLVDRVVPAALEAGARSIVAPWLRDDALSETLALALQAYGADIAFHGEDNQLQLAHDSYDAYLASLPARKRRRIKEDRDRAAASPARIERLDGEQLRPLVGRIAELTSLNRQKYDGGEDSAHIAALLTGMLDGGVDVRAYLAFLDEEVVASLVTLRQGKLLIIKWAGFDYEAIGERSGLYFELVLDRPLRDAYAEDVQVIQAGPGADQAKRLRGFQPARIRSAVFVSDASLRDQVAQLHTAYAEARREALGASADQEPTTAIGRLKAKLRGNTAYEPVKPLQPEGGCCG